MKVLIVHHVQEMWNTGLTRQGTSFNEVLSNVYTHINEVNYDKVIVTNFESFELEDSQHCLAWFNPSVYEYGYGWDMEQVHQNEQSSLEQAYADFANGELYTDVHGTRWAEGGAHSEAVIVDDWMLSLTNDEVHLCGAFEGECIEDMEIALAAAGIEVNRVNSLIV